VTGSSAKRLKKKSRALKPFSIRNKVVPRASFPLPGDKSIAHRALILSALSRGKAILKNFPFHDDSLATLKALENLGVKIQAGKNEVCVRGRGLRGLRPCRGEVFADNSGTTLRLLLGVLAGFDFKTRVTAGKYLSRRPMSRVNIPLRLMGARIVSRLRGGEEYAPVTISGGNLKGIDYSLKIASAQVKSAILLAGLFAAGRTRVRESLKTRDHTERMLKAFGAGICVKGKAVTLVPGREFSAPERIYIPGDISSASFFMVLAAAIPGSRVRLKGVGLNPGRSGIIGVLKRMGARIKISPASSGSLKNFEPFGDILVCGGALKGAVVESREIPSLIDELPVLMVAACFARGRTLIKGAGELRFKETDRINSMVFNLKRMGADIRILKSGPLENISIDGRGRLRGADLKSFGDHRTAMSMVVAGLASGEKFKLDDTGCINKSFPGFIEAVKRACGI
jgi:3-phosphoshikimate 1-carboxyvinyltransferase